MTEHARTAEELILRTRKRQSCSEFEFYQMKCANQVSYLKQSIARWFYILCEFDGAVDASLKLLMEHSGNRSLSAIIVYLDAFKRIEEFLMRENKIIQGGLEPSDDLIRRSNEFLVDTQTMVFVIDLSGESHHAREYPSSQLAAKHGVVLFTTNERPSMKAVTLKPNFSVGAFQTNDVGSDINRLVVKNHSNDIKPRFGIREAKISRFINKDTKSFRFHHQSLKKERVAGHKSYHSRGVLSPHPGDPFHNEEINDIVAYRRLNYK